METFLVQVWVAADDRSRGGDLRGVVRHVATGTETPFRGGEEMLLLLRAGDGTTRKGRRPLDPGTAHPTLEPHG